MDITWQYVIKRETESGEILRLESCAFDTYYEARYNGAAHKEALLPLSKRIRLDIRPYDWRGRH